MLLVGDSSWIVRMQNDWKKKAVKYYANANQERVDMPILI